MPSPADTTGARPDRLRTHAIELYCRELCGSDRMAAGSADALSSISPADAWGGDYQLLRVTRTAAAAHVPPKAAPSGWRGMLAAEHENDCVPTPALLAQRANGELTPSRQLKLENHLARCLFCRAAEVREQRASRAFSAVLATGIPASRRPDSAEPAPEPAAPAVAAAAAGAVAEPPTATHVVEPTLPPEPEPEPEQTVALSADAVGAGALGAAAAAAGPAGVKAGRDPLGAEAASRRGLVVYPAREPRFRRGGRDRAPGGLIAAVSAYRPFLLTLLLGGLVILGVALALGGGASAQNAAASLPPPSASSTPPAAVGIAATRHTPKPHPAPKPKPKATTTPTTGTTATTATTSSSSGTPQAAANGPAATPNPAANTPAPPTNNQPAQQSAPQGNGGGGGGGSGSGGGGSSSSPVVATQQGTGLPAQSAPTQTIGGGG